MSPLPSPRTIYSPQAIFELTTGEEQYVKDLVNLQRVFMKPMRTLGYITAEEERRIFGNIEELATIHSELCAAFGSARETNGVACIGSIFLEWVRPHSEANSSTSVRCMPVYYRFASSVFT